jgi:hypothetical protein
MGLGPKWSCGNAPLADKKCKIGFSCDRSTPGISWFDSASASEDYGVNPNPYRFRVIWAEVHNGHTVMMVNYPNCTTFNGDKLLLLRGIWPITMRKLDPHFLDALHPVIARFLPTTEGIFLARAAALAL